MADHRPIAEVRADLRGRLRDLGVDARRAEQMAERSTRKADETMNRQVKEGKR